MKSFQRIISIALIAAFMFSFASFAADTAKDVTVTLRQDAAVTIDKKEVKLTDSKERALYPIQYDDTTYLPVKAINSAAGKAIDWSIKNQSEKAEKEVIASLRQDFKLIIDGKQKTLKNSAGNTLYPIEYKGTLYLPAKTISSSTGQTATWSFDKKTITIAAKVSNATSEKAAEKTVDRVYWVANGKSYHFTENCVTLKRSKKIFSGSLEEALKQGKKDPCNVCAKGK